MNRDITVLLVDDDEIVTACVLAWLEDEGFVVHTAGCGEEMLKVMASTAVDVALVDLQLADRNGEDLIVEAAALYPRTRFMVHTGKHRYQLPDNLLELGLRQCDVVFKPIFDLDLLSAAIRRLVTGVAEI